MKRHLTLAIAAAVIMLGGCEGESSLPTPTGKGSIRALNAIPRSPEISFLIEERVLGSARFQAATNSEQYDDFEYTFHFETLLAGDTSLTRVASQVLDVQADTDYTFVVSGDFTSPDVAVWESPQREWNDADTVFEVRAGHLATSLGMIDIYIADEMTPPALGSQVATIGLDEVSPALDLEAGDYVVTVTPAGDDSTILYASDPVTFGAQAQFVISLFDGDENDLGTVVALTLNQTNGVSAEIADSRFPPNIRFIHASMSLGNADIYVDEPITTPIATDHAFMDVTDFFDVAAGGLPVTYTVPGDTGMLLFNVIQPIVQGSRTDFYALPTSSGTDFTFGDIFDRRAVDTTARLGLINAAVGRDAVDLYLVPSGELIDEATPLVAGLPLTAAPFTVPITPASYDIYVTDTGEKIPLAGPIPLVVDFGDVLQAMILENVQPTVVDFAFIPQP